MQIHGHVDPRFEGVRDAFAANFAQNGDIGASFCATIKGEVVVDIWGVVADSDSGAAWQRDTIVNVYSTTKTMCALSALLLADRGDLDFARPVADYWPEFAVNGKARVTTAQLMAHSAGLSGWHEKIDKTVLYDWEKATGLLAAQAPFWEPGTAPGYHGLTQGFLVGEVIRRITGVSPGTFFRTELAEPLGADFHIGLPASADARVATLIPPPAGQGIADMSDRPLTRNMSTNPAVNPLETRTRAWRGAEIPAANGHGNARSVALVQTLVANGGVANDKQVISAAGVRRVLESQISGDDLVLAIPVHFGLGYGLSGGQMPLPNAESCFWGGYGGSLVINDLAAQTTFAYAMNMMAGTTTGDMRAFSLAIAMWQGMAAG